jgi:hypothetical protein
MTIDRDVREACLIGLLASPIAEFCVVTAVDSGYLTNTTVFYVLMCIVPLGIGTWVFQRKATIAAAGISSVVATLLFWIFIIRPREWSAFGYLFNWPLVMLLAAGCIAIGGFATRAIVNR